MEINPVVVNPRGLRKGLKVALYEKFAIAFALVGKKIAMVMLVIPITQPCA